MKVAMRRAVRERRRGRSSLRSPGVSVALWGDDHLSAPRISKSGGDGRASSSRGSDGDAPAGRRRARRTGPTTREKMFATLNDPDYSSLAKYISLTILALIVTSTTTFIMDTIREFENNAAIAGVEYFCIAAFTLEYVGKLATVPREHRAEWLNGKMNMIDLAAILPFYIELIVVAATSSEESGAPSGLLRLFRLFRVFRVLKLGAKMRKLEVVAAAVADSIDLLLMLIFILVLTLVLFSTLLYFCEDGAWEASDALDAYAGDPFASIPRCFWWCTVTLMTVGYGDAYPITGWGKVVAAATMVVSVVITALPISVVGANFTQQWLLYREREATKTRASAMMSNFQKLSDAIRVHDYVLDEVLAAVEEMEILIEQDLASMKRLFNTATTTDVTSGNARARRVAKNARRATLVAFDAKFARTQDAREELDQLLSFADLLGTPGFLSQLDLVTSKNDRLSCVMDAVEDIFTEVDALIVRVNEVNESGTRVLDGAASARRLEDGVSPTPGGNPGGSASERTSTSLADDGAGAARDLEEALDASGGSLGASTTEGRGDGEASAKR
ncbi:voltage-gated ion channel superfamily [Micromonas pusilla CCMP1545]|uniref:Voltage-gated ion channel superfamily n=1 Tax=Micromonas pusilla (strain CCMP1545) TaxID=564608 RepID=C1MJG5_MICPC|nr:voltage-gated ion channel superfamily [Micromonas pusilla CCMP1545]EEH59992.1 voltage-gated ion channel superfamily [Micromonas pusilla CCMP1545]|eukprot:XP_003056616.1 voltage-gated ion channel superfamily [Micromonas pusilla CCMP1545]